MGNSSGRRGPSSRRYARVRCSDMDDYAVWAWAAFLDQEQVNRSLHDKAEHLLHKLIIHRRVFTEYLC